MTSINGKRRRIGDDVVYFFIYLCAALSVVLLAGIIIYVFVRGIGQVNWQFLTSETSVLRGTVGIAGNLLNTLYIIIAVSVQLEPVPAITGTRLFTLSIANLIVLRCSPCVIVDDSPVVPQIMIASVLFAI